MPAAASSSSTPSAPSIYWFTVDNDAYDYSAPLMPAATLIDCPTRSPSTTASSFIRRRPARSPPRHRRGHADPTASHPFDDLSWISLMDAPPSADIHDIADLSQLPVESVGPVRRSRKTSLRTSPMRAGSRSARNSATTTPSIVLPSYLTERCTTPPPSAPRNFADVRFEHLMPQNWL